MKCYWLLCMFPFALHFALGQALMYHANFCSTPWKFIYFRKDIFCSTFIIFSYIYRFKCIDLDGNGVITHNEMQFFYEEQHHRMECMALEPVIFEDILCQIVDMISPQVKS